MSVSCELVVNGRTVRAKIGQTLIDAGLGGSIVIPHDCCAGQCDTCRVDVVAGAIADQGTREGRTVLACQATLAGDAEIRFDEIAPVRTLSGTITAIEPLSNEVFEVCVRTNGTLDHKPGQYASVKFSGFPARDLSPSLSLDGALADDRLVFHIRRYPGGLVSTQIGATIRVGHRVRVRGPFGQAFLRPGAGPLVLVSGGTGFAPIWSIARSARVTQPHRDLVVIAGVRDMEDCYMRPALQWLSDHGVREVLAAAEHGAQWPVVSGRPTHYLPSLGPEDTVYVAGPQGLVDAVKQKSRAATARCYADPFLPGSQTLSFVDRIVQLMRAPGAQRKAAPALPGQARASAGARSAASDAESSAPLAPERIRQKTTA